jgi:hypothetical protein
MFEIVVDEVLTEKVSSARASSKRFSLLISLINTLFLRQQGKRQSAEFGEIRAEDC